MTKQNNRYENTKIYKLIDHESGYFYIGSTTDRLSHRLSVHKCKALQYTDRKVYKAFNEIGWEHIKIVLIEEHYLNNREQQLREEDRVIQMYIHESKCLNSNRAWSGLNKNEYMKQYREENKDQIKEQMKEYYEINKDKLKECMKQYYENNKDKLKKYREENKDKIHEYMKQYREENKEKIHEYKNESFNCTCGGKYTRCNKTKHAKSKKHLAWLYDQKVTAETI